MSFLFTQFGQSHSLLDRPMMGDLLVMMSDLLAMMGDLLSKHPKSAVLR